MGNTGSPYNLPWPELPDVADGPDAFMDLANATEIALNSVKTYATTGDNSIKAIIGTVPSSSTSVIDYVNDRDNIHAAEYKDLVADLRTDVNPVTMVKSLGNRDNASGWTTMPMRTVVTSSGDGLTGSPDSTITTQVSGLFLVITAAAWEGTDVTDGVRGVGTVTSSGATPAEKNRAYGPIRKDNLFLHHTMVLALGSGTSLYLATYAPVATKLLSAFFTVSRLGKL